MSAVPHVEVFGHHNPRTYQRERKMELDSRNSPWNSGMALRWDVALKEVYYLLCIFYGSEGFDSLDEVGKKFTRVEFQEVEINRILLMLAVTIRNMWDQDSSFVEMNLKNQDTNTGVLICNLKNPNDDKPLEFREALNKIIHCTSINYEYKSSQPRMGDSVLPRVHLYGTKKNGKKDDLNWKASLDIIKFCTLVTYVA